MDFGIGMFPTHYAIGPGPLAAAAQQRGFDSIFFPEHTHIPASRRTPHPSGNPLPRQYLHTYDLFVAMTAAAAATTTLKIGAAICLIIQRDPIVTAKEVASLDHLSGGRVLFGVGAGWNREEMENHGTDPRTRMALMAERVHAMKRIWTEDEAQFHGRYVNFDPIFSWPKPIARPHPPVLVGGMGPGVLDRVLDFGDEWLPQAVTLANVDAFAERAGELQRRAAAAGRPAVPMTLFGATPDAESIAAYAEVGINRCVFTLPADDAAATLPRLDALADLIG